MGSTSRAPIAIGLIELYARFTGIGRSFRDIVYECKKLVLRASMSGEQNVLARKLDQISEQHRWSRDFTLNSLGRVLAEVIACFPVYRSYVTSEGGRPKRTAARSGRDRHRQAPQRRAQRVNLRFPRSRCCCWSIPSGLDEAARARTAGFHAALSAADQPGDGQGI